METPSLEYFLEIASSASLSEAAARLHISQQGLSSYLQKLEKHYGMKFIERKPKLTLTPAGERILTAARQVNQIYVDLGEDLKVISSTQEVRITIGILTPMMDLAMRVIPLSDYGIKYPMVFFKFISGYQTEILTLLQQGKLDFGILGIQDMTPEQESFFHVRHLAHNRECLGISDEMICAYFPDAYPMCISRFQGGISMREFAHVPIMLPPSNTGIFQKLRRYYASNHLKLKLYGESSSQEVISSLVAQNMACGLFRENSLPQFKQRTDKHIYFFPIDEPHLFREDALICLKKREFPEYLSELMDLTVERWSNRVNI